MPWPADFLAARSTLPTLAGLISRERRWNRMSDPLDSVAASQLATAAILAALVATLARKGVLTDREVKETYESALLMIEEGQGASPEAELVFAAARDLIEEHLRATGDPPDDPA